MSKLSRLLYLLVLLCLLSMVTRSDAASVTVMLDPGITQITTSGLTTVMATGADMAGINVTTFFSNGSSETALWGTTGFQAGGALGTGWQLTQSGDTIFSDWMLTNSSTTLSINRLLIDAGLGNTVFDAIESPASTTNSGLGFPFLETSGPGVDILATYRDAVALAGFTPVGDLFRSLDIAFTGPGGFAPGNTLTYLADTDSLLVPGDLVPGDLVPGDLVPGDLVPGGLRPVPEPNTLILLGTCLVILFHYGWRRQK